MYADDGVFVGNAKGIIQFKEWLQKINLTGATIAEEKTGVAPREFTILRCLINRDKETVLLEDGTLLS